MLNFKEIIGSTGWEIISARHKIDTIIKSSKESGPYTHFISIPMNYESIISNFEEFKTEVLTNSGKNSREIDENIFQKNRKLHLTIQMLRLFDAEDKKKAAENLHACKEEIIEYVNLLSAFVITFKCFQILQNYNLE